MLPPPKDSWVGRWRGPFCFSMFLHFGILSALLVVSSGNGFVFEREGRAGGAIFVSYEGPAADSVRQDAVFPQDAVAIPSSLASESVIPPPPIVSREPLIPVSVRAPLPKPVPVTRVQTARAKSSAPPLQRASSMRPPAADPSLPGQGVEGAGTGRGLQGTGPGAGFGLGAMRARVRYAPKPPYPYAARRAGFEGRVVLDLSLDENGTVREAQLVSGSGRPDCDDAALSTIYRRWRFDPAKLDGRAVPSNERVVVVFNLDTRS